jgi:hypothetical protein
MNNLSVFQIKAGSNYSVKDFDADLRESFSALGANRRRSASSSTRATCCPPLSLSG